jgi:hypothetical protein
MTARLIRPVRLASAVITPVALVRVSVAASRAVVKLARSGSVPGPIRWR